MKFAKKSASAKLNAELLGLMVNEPNLSEEELVLILNRKVLEFLSR